MPRQIRQRSNTGIYHVMLRGINRQDIFEDKEDYVQFLRILSAIVNRKDERGTPLPQLCTLYAYCLMSNHVHLLIRERQENVSQNIKRIGVAYASYYNHKYERNGHLFQDRFRSETVNTIEYFMTLIRYIHQNPVKAGQVAEVKDYPWSSWHEYEGKPSEYPICDTETVIKRLERQNLYEFVTMPVSEEGILDFHDDCCNNYTDDEVKDFIKNTCGIDVATNIQKLQKYERNLVLKRLCDIGITIRQISRITGVSYGVISRAKSGA